VVDQRIIVDDVVGLDSWLADYVQTRDSRTLVRRGGGFNSHLPNYRENPGFGIVIAVSTDAQVHLVLEGVGSVSGHETEQRVLWGLGHNIYCEGTGHGCLKGCNL
jgi:hypothetical protein